MKREELLDYVAQLIVETTKTGICHAHLCAWEDKLQCLPANHTNEQHTVFLYFNNLTRWPGFSSPEWNHLEQQIWNFMKENQ